MRGVELEAIQKRIGLGVREMAWHLGFAGVSGERRLRKIYVDRQTQVSTPISRVARYMAKHYEDYGVLPSWDEEV